MPRLLPLVALLLIVAPAPASAATPDPQATSLLGRPLIVPERPPGTFERFENALETLRLRSADHPDDADALVWIGRQLGYMERYDEAIEAFSEGIERFPDDARFRRHRGHRRITLRDLDGAVEDLEAGIALAAGRPDRVEPDGLPNLYNRPTGTLKSNLWYHLGLAHYLSGDFVRAAEAYGTCAALADNPDLLVAASYWQVLSLMRSGRIADAQAVLARAPLDAVLLENGDYQNLLRLFAAGREGDDLAEALLDGSELGTVSAVTRSYGVGAWHLLGGRRGEAMEVFRQVVDGTDGEGWPAFGFIAAEAELARDAPQSAPVAIQ